MGNQKPLIICEPEAVGAAAIATGYEVLAFPGSKDDYSDRRVILWPDATPESRAAFRQLAESISDICSELKIIIPNGRPHGWNIARAVESGETWDTISKWARVSMMVFGNGELSPKLAVETTEAPDPVVPSVEAIWNSVGIARATGGSVIYNVDNIVRLLAGYDRFRDMIWHDDFYGRYFTTTERRVREWSDIDDINLTVLLQHEFGFPRLQVGTVTAAVQCRGHQCRRNEPKDWISKLKWDGQSRIDSFFATYLGSPASAYTAAVGRNFWIGMIARIYRPGCQLDNMVILEGKQGIFKSKALEAIGGKWYMEAAEDITSKDFFGAMAGKLIIEIADLDSFSRADTNRIKKVITCRVDRYRKPYGRATQDHPRQSIFVGTTNEQHYLRDNTGARRFWPIPCGHILLDRLRNDREQLFGEARTRYISGEDWYRVPNDETMEQQENRREYDEWENIIQEYTIGKSEINVMDLAAFLGFDKSRIDKISQRRIGTILRHFGWDRRTVRRGALTPKLWFPGGSAAELTVSRELPLGASPNGSLPETV